MKTVFSKRLLTVLTALVVLFSAVTFSASALETSSGDPADTAYAYNALGVPYYGRSALETLSNATALLYAYDAIAAGVEAAQDVIYVYNGTDPITQDELAMVYDAYRRDYAHHLWIGNTYSMGYTSVSVVNVSMPYLMSGEALTAARQAFDTAAAQMLQCINDEMSDFEKELALHDALAAKITYTSSANAHNAYGALVEGQAVCEGYAEALQYLLQCAGVQSFIAIGDSVNQETGQFVGHAWNYVRIDGDYYHVDLTWNDQDQRLYHAYFNQTDSVITQDHILDTTVYPLPVCTATAANYHIVKGSWMDTYTVESIGTLLKENDLCAKVYITGDMQTFITWFQENIRAIAKAAGVKGGFSYGYGALGKEAEIYLKRATFSGASVNVGADLSMLYYVKVYDLTMGDLEMRFTVNGKTVTAKEYAVTTDNVFVFTLTGLPPQKMGDTIDAALYAVNGETETKLAEKTGYSIEQNCKDLLSQNGTDAPLVQFINDLLVYGAAAQTYTGYNTTDLVGAGMDLTVGTAVPPVSDKMTITGNDNADCYIKSVGVWFDTTNNLYLKIFASDDSFTVAVDGQTYTAADCEALGSNVYKLTCDALAATALDTVYTFSLDYAGSACAQLDYSANAYACAVLTGSSSNEKMMALAQALYCYGLSAESYVAAH